MPRELKQVSEAKASQVAVKHWLEMAPGDEDALALAERLRQVEVR